MNVAVAYSVIQATFKPRRVSIRGCPDCVRQGRTLTIHTHARPSAACAPKEKERERITVDSTWSEDELLSNYGYDSDALLREVYGPILENSPERDRGTGTPRRVG